MKLVDELIRKAKSIDFRKTVDRPLSPFHTDLLVLPVIDKNFYRHVLGSLFYYKNEVCVSGAFYDDSKILDCEEEIIKTKDLADKRYLGNRALMEENSGDELIDFCKKGSDSTKFSKEEQINFIKKYIIKTESFVPWFTVTISVGNYLEKEIEKEIISQIGDKRKAKTFTIILTAPNRLSLHSIEENDFLKVAKLFSSGRKVNDLIDDHISKYGFIGFKDGLGEFWTREDVLQRLMDCKKPEIEVKKSLENRNRKKKEAQELIKKLKPDDRLLKLVDHAKKFVWLRTYRSDIYNYAFALVAHLMNDYVKSLGYKDKDYLNFTVCDFLGDPTPSKKELEAREKSFASIGIDSKHYYLSGTDSLQFKKVLDNKVSFDEKIRGTVACKVGVKIRGVVKIVNSPKDLIKVNKEDIIVSTMTTPNFVIKMKIASGFITDEGGILCHAAIISREMGKPCIVGTKNATKIFKDLDMVEMDLRNGTVKRINSL